MIPSWGSPQYWFGEKVSTPARRKMQSQFQGKVESEWDLATQMIGYGALGLGHVGIGAGKYAYLANIGVKLEKSRRVISSYNLALAERKALMSGLVGKGRVRSSMIYNIVRSPGKAAAMKAARFVRIAGRLHPIGLMAALAYDIYEGYVNRSVWGWKIPG